MTSPYLNKPLRSEAEVRSLRALFSPDEDFLGLADSLFDACCAMKAEEEMAREWENGAVERMNYDGRRS